MKTLLTITVCAALVGAGFGAALAVVEVHPWNTPTRSGERTTAASSSAQAPTPRAEVPETTFKFGQIERGTSMSHVFKIRNVGDAPLRVEVGSTTCKCTVGKLSKNEIGPHEEADVQLQWTAKTLPGPFRHGATLLTNDPRHSRIELHVEGRVVEATSIQPAELVFGAVHVGESRQAHLYLMSFVDHEVQVLSYQVAGAKLAKQVDVQIAAAQPSELPASDAKSGLKVTVVYHAGQTIGPFRGVLTLKTNLKKARQLTVPLLGSVVGDISIFGPGWSARQGLLRLGTIHSEQGKRVRLKVAVRGKHAQTTRLEIAEVDPPELKATLGKVRVMNDKLVHVPLLVEVPPGTRHLVRMGEPTSSDAHIVLRATQPEPLEVHLRVHFAVGP